MRVLNFEFDFWGRPVVELYVGVGTTQRLVRGETGGHGPGPRPVLSLIDTGADRSQVDQSVLKGLDLPPVGPINLFTASTGADPEVRKTYVVDLAFSGDRPGPLAHDLRVIGSDHLAGLKVQMLLGRDVLNGCLLTYDGPNRRLLLAYDPPARP